MGKGTPDPSVCAKQAIEAVRTDYAKLLEIAASVINVERQERADWRLTTRI
jgi:hypothetical protein